LLASSELKPARFREQLALERSRGLVREVEGEGVLDAVGNEASPLSWFELLVLGKGQATAR
jgi:hypothetical protein